MDFTNVETINEVELNINGWKPLKIKYGLLRISRIIYLIWNIEGTSHYFKTNLQYVTANHGGHYNEHFIATLIKFRLDLINWYYGKEKDLDMSKYLNEFSSLITELR